ncbi:Ig-like domain-containing protein [uncultured Cellulomonas sp.]|uniref:Ig-like domain-containing protein n=1 Tax=uncultured Cellulomonas sp. TaxID=189682 RepID=UPI00261D66BB|nr:Ig-like domain-containing protein [uncultured Cellulomonas sp.]
MTGPARAGGAVRAATRDRRRPEVRLARRVRPAPPGWTRATWTRAGAAVTAPVVLAVLALVHPGQAVSQLDLHDGGVWLTNASTLGVGRYSSTVDELNGGLVATSPEVDVLQDAADVLVHEPGALAVVDPAAVTTTAGAALPDGARVSMAAGTVAVVDPADGSLWAGHVDALGSLGTDGPPDAELGAGGAAVVSRTGDVLTVAADGVRSTLRVDDDGVRTRVVASAEPVAGGAGGPVEQVTAVGGELVTLTGTTLGTPAGPVDLAAYGSPLRLQQPGPAAGTVLVAGPTALLEVALADGTVRSHASGGSGAPAAPVRLGTCAYAAWASATGSSLTRCGTDRPRVLDLEGMTAQDRLVFRVNRSVVVLNDTARGRVWVPAEDPDLREPSWQDIAPQDDQSADEEDSDTQRGAVTSAARCSGESGPPTATDDDLGVRPGRTTLLPVLANDAASDCGVLVVSQVDPLPADFGELTAVHGGRALQLRVADGATGTESFTYTVTDGRGSAAPSTATVRVTVHPDGTSTAPGQVRIDTLVVEQGAQVSADVLPAFADPDGDELVLAEATVEGEGTVRSRPDGHLTYVAGGGALGVRTVRLLVSDGTATVAGELRVDVRPAGSVAPVVDPVHAEAYVGEPVTVRPLASVRSGTGEAPRLVGVDPVVGATVVPDLTAGTFTLTAQRPGPLYVGFTVAAGTQATTGVARVDVRESRDRSADPVAVADRALLPAGGEVTVDPLANDVSPTGRVLVLRSVDVPEGSGLEVATLAHGLLRIGSAQHLAAPVVVGYVVSDGERDASGQVLVVPVPAGVQGAPVVPDVTATVRAGGVVTIPVLDGATDPDGDRLALVRELAETPAPGEGQLFVSGDVLRFRAPDHATTARATFSVTDGTSTTSAVLTVTVHDSDAAAKAPPRPVPVTVRAFEEETIRIPVPLVGIDADGDGVTLLGADRAPGKGRITDRGADWLEYQALPNEVGTDEFTYAVEDWVGQRAVATIRVGIAPRPTTAPTVVARDDHVTVLPGRRVEVRVLTNDVDPDGGELLLDDEIAAPTGVDARVEGRRVVVQAPQEAGEVHVEYTARTARGGHDTAVLTVTVDPEATVQHPVARDVVVPATETVGRNEVEVDVLAVAENPGGPLSDLVVSVDRADAATARVTASGAVVVTLADRPQTLPYVLTNSSGGTGLATTAFITVPARGDFPPMLRPRAPRLEVLAGEPLPISLAEQVQVAPGRTATVTDVSRVQATKADGSPLVLDDRTLVYRAPRSYAGPASISVEVTDGLGSGDAAERRAVLTLPITVLAVEDHPPAFVPSTIDVAPGEAPVRVDLTAFTSDPVGRGAGWAGYTYRITSAVPQGFTVTLDGSELRVSAAATAARGTFGSLGVTIGYGAAGSLDARVELRVSASSRPLARVVERTVTDGVEDRVTTVPVLDGAYNPFPGSPLTVVDAVVETPGAGTAAAVGSAVAVRPAAGFVGPMVTRFTVRDATGDSAREVTGRVTVVVRGRPATPVAPRVVEARDRTVVLAWDAPAANGEPVTSYRVTTRPGGAVRECAGTTCTIDGLVNDTEYTFTVAARNAVDWSADSAASPVARPDARPEAATAPVVVPGDRQLTATWAPTVSPGSPVDRYTVEVSPAPPAGATLTTAGTTTTLRGLTNGTEYVVRVRAHNRTPQPGDWSPWSVPAVPATTPSAPVPTSVRHAAAGGEAGRLEVTWASPDANGAPVTGYELAVDGAPAATLPASATTWSFPDAERGHRYTVTVRARNSVGWSAWGSTTAETWSAPTPPQGAAATDLGGADVAWGAGRVELTWQPPADAGGTGVTVTGYEVEGVGRVSGTSVVVPGLVAGPSPTFRVRAWSSRDEAGDWAVIAPVAVTTAPEAPTVTAEATVTADGALGVRVRWTPRRDGGTPVTGFRVRVDGGEWVAHDPTVREASLVVPRGPAAPRVEVRAVGARGASASGAATATLVESAPTPAPTPVPTPAVPAVPPGEARP